MNLNLNPEFGPSLFARLRAVIADEIPSGSHRARAEGWRRLSQRCAETAKLHDAHAEKQESTTKIVRSFAPAYREIVLEQLKKGERITFEQDGLPIDPPGEGLNAEPMSEGREYTLTPTEFEAALQPEGRRAKASLTGRSTSVEGPRLQNIRYVSAPSPGFAPMRTWAEFNAKLNEPGFLKPASLAEIDAILQGDRAPKVPGELDPEGLGAPASWAAPSPPDGAMPGSVWRWLTVDELRDQQVWTGRIYRDLTPEERRDGKTHEPTDKQDPETVGP